MQGLHDVRVIDFSTEIAGPYATKLFVDAGAEVVKVEPANGDPLRRGSASGADLAGRDGALFQYLHAGKRSVTGTPGDEAVLDLVADADLVVESFGPGGMDVRGLRERFPHLVILSISAFGAGGPYSERPATEFIVQAESGSIASRGRPDWPPYQAGGRISEWTGGVYGAAAALAAVRRAQRTGTGDHIDLSLVEVMAIAGSTYLDLSMSLFGRPDLGPKARMIETPSIEPARDGWVGFNTNARQQWNDFLLLIERPDLLADESLANVAVRGARIDEWNEIVHGWTRQHTVDEIVERAALLRIPSTQVCDGKRVLEHPHLVARRAFVENPGGFRQPRRPYRIDDQDPAPVARAPRQGEHAGAIAPRARPALASPPSVARALLLQGLRILDLTSWWAGPAATNFMATLGAEVIHVESTGRPDGMRLTGFMFAQPQWWERGHLFLAVNTNKRGITLDLQTAEGLDLLRRLIPTCDAIVENFSPRVMEQFGLGWEAVHAIDPRVVLVRMPAFGLDGPWRDRVGFAQTMEQMSGLAWVTGFVEDQPRIQRGPCDPIAGMHGAFALMVALAERDRTGVGRLVESTMVEAALSCAAEPIVEYSAYGRVLERMGNRSPHAAPQGIYACRGEERWLAISIADDAHWHALVGALGRPQWSLDPALDSLTGRHRAHDRIDRELSRWAAERELDDAVAHLVSHGVPAGRVFDPRIASRHPQMVARRFYEEIDHPVVGRHPTPGMPFRCEGVDHWLCEPAPTLGQHTREVLGRLLGLDAATLDDLEARGVIGEHPRGL
jgi:crotonobetainyl-CoA:carnitine CoA-transferase CaiB-like acyl-CoA transferase